ncbi:hypothetical protein EAF04_007839 [Stromatinia cepivora]|nr:hypothetical protein EAF04_007839 [Stromatinia cepivora]
MHFLDLAPELIHKILLEAVFIRGVRRSLKLKLVCKRFSKDVQFALFESQILDSYSTCYLLSDWYIRKDQRASNFWHSYLVYRVQYHSDSCQSRPNQLRRVAETLCAETGDDLKATIETLCWPALEEGTCCGEFESPSKSQDDFELDLLCAAAYLNVIPVVKRLIDGKYSPFSSSPLFGPVMRLAAWAGNTHILEYLQQKTVELEGLESRSALLDGYYYSVTGAARSGDLDMVRLAVFPPSRTTRESMDLMVKSFLHVDRGSKDAYAIFRSDSSTRNLEVYKYLEGFYEKPVSELRGDLEKHAHLGNLEIVRYILDGGINIRVWPGQIFLAAACRGNHEDVVDLLLERGANPIFGCKNQSRLGWLGDQIVSIGAKARNSPIVRKLLNRGATLNHIRTNDSALRWAVSSEDTVMLKMLLALDIDLETWGVNMLSIAAQCGADSMVDLLQTEFFNLTVLQRARWMLVLNGTIDPNSIYWCEYVY